MAVDKTSKTGSGSGGLSGFDLGAIQQALGQDITMLNNRYQQLGIGVPDPNVFGGDPLTAAQQGGSLAWGSPGTAEQTDISGLNQLANASLGQLQQQNQSNPAISGTPANQIQNIQTANQNTGTAAFGQGAGLSGGNLGAS